MDAQLEIHGINHPSLVLLPSTREQLELTVEVCPFRPSRKVFTCINENI